MLCGRRPTHPGGGCHKWKKYLLHEPRGGDQDQEPSLPVASRSFNNLVKSVQSICSLASLNAPSSPSSLCLVPGREKAAHSQNLSHRLIGCNLTCTLQSKKGRAKCHPLAEGSSDARLFLTILHCLVLRHFCHQYSILTSSLATCVA